MFVPNLRPIYHSYPSIDVCKPRDYVAALLAIILSSYGRTVVVYTDINEEKHVLI